MIFQTNNKNKMNIKIISSSIILLFFSLGCGSDITAQTPKKNIETIVFFDLTQSCFNNNIQSNNELNYCIKVIKKIIGKNLRNNKDRLTISYIGDSKPSSRFNLILELKGIKNCNHLSGLANLTCIAQNNQLLKEKLNNNSSLVEKFIRQPDKELMTSNFVKKTNILSSIRYASELFVNSNSQKEIYYFSDLVETKNFDIKNLIKSNITNLMNNKNVKQGLDDLKNNKISYNLKGVKIHYYMPGRQLANNGSDYEKYESFWLKFFNSLSLKIFAI